MNNTKVVIPIAAAEAPPATGNALPILHEIETLLNGLVTSGKAASIDLRSLPMLPGDYEQLQ
ncbi:MAG TPA: hydrogenase expression/formation C-terminal domain-containing protein, partial [Candidatus Methylomirabilis sp.]|nr:hydrogenase expression/formation C-terminal domain-containing protein [Candidatus Methylomirabilis sp.]